MFKIHTDHQLRPKVEFCTVSEAFSPQRRQRQHRRPCDSAIRRAHQTSFLEEQVKDQLDFKLAVNAAD